jgi:hypothetical protein
MWEADLYLGLLFPKSTCPEGSELLSYKGPYGMFPEQSDSWLEAWSKWEHGKSGTGR